MLRGFVGIYIEFVLIFSFMVICLEALLFPFRQSISFNLQYVFRKAVPFLAVAAVILSRLYKKVLPTTYISSVSFSGSPLVKAGHEASGFQTWMIVTYCAVTLFLILHYILRYVVFVNHIQDGTKITDKYKAELAGRKISVYASAVCKTPFCFGMRKKVIAFPDDYQSNDSYAIRHEISHCDNHDPLVMVGAKLLSLIMWFNPFAHIYYQKIRMCCEYACDERLTHDMSFDEKKKYILTILDSTPRETPVVFGAALSTEKTLKRRFSNILMNVNAKKSNKKVVALILVSTVVLVAAIIVIASICIPDKMSKHVKVNYAPGKEVAQSVEYEEYNMEKEKWFAGELYLDSTEDAGYGIKCGSYTGILYERDF